MACNCIDTMNGKLAGHNGQLITTLFGTPKVVIGSVKVDGRKRGKPPYAIASYCPFCGAEYPASPGGAPVQPSTPEDGQAVSTPEDADRPFTRSDPAPETRR